MIVPPGPFQRKLIADVPGTKAGVNSVVAGSGEASTGWPTGLVVIARVAETICIAGEFRGLRAVVQRLEVEQHGAGERQDI